MRRTASKHALVLMALMCLGTLSQSVSAQSQCVATNDNEDQMCNVSCPLGQTAACNAGIGSSAPKCVCSGASTSMDPAVSGYRETSASRTDGH
jgi:hypothetical protein